MPTTYFMSLRIAYESENIQINIGQKVRIEKENLLRPILTNKSYVIYTLLFPRLQRYKVQFFH